MKINSTDSLFLKPLIKLFENNKIQKYAEWGSKPQNRKLINDWLPPFESSFATSLYMLNAYYSKDIPKDQKRVIIASDFACGAFGITSGVFINKWIKKIEDNIVEGLKESQIKDVKKITGGIRVIVPLFIISFTMRYLAPVLSTSIASMFFNGKKPSVGTTQNGFQKYGYLLNSNILTNSQISSKIQGSKIDYKT